MEQITARKMKGNFKNHEIEFCNRGWVLLYYKCIYSSKYRDLQDEGVHGSQQFPAVGNF